MQPHQLPTDPDTLEIIWRDRISVSPELATILDKMVRYHFRDRYQSAAETLQAFNSLISPTHLSPTIPSFPPSATPSPQKSSPLVQPKLKLWLSIIGLGIAGAAVIATLIYLPQLRRQPTQTSPSPTITW